MKLCTFTLQGAKPEKVYVNPSTVIAVREHKKGSLIITVGSTDNDAFMIAVVEEPPKVQDVLNAGMA